MLPDHGLSAADRLRIDVVGKVQQKRLERPNLYVVRRFRAVAVTEKILRSSTMGRK
jgi:hypothetical protein